MSKPFRFGSAASLVALATMLGGCVSHETRVVAPSLFGNVDSNIGLATRAVAALNSNNVPLAIDLAERAVAKSPNDAGYRTVLGNAYFAGGRFWSAEAALKDALSLYPNQPQALLKLVLAEVALGKKDEALRYLESGRGMLDGADYGLALALAGQPREAATVLEQIARQPNADARVRQNLALAFALTGDWTSARTVAAQDVPASQLDQRIQQWMLLANPAKASDQVAALVGVTPVQRDQGQPMRLALRKPEAAQAVAAATPAPAPVQVQAPAPAPFQVAEIPAPQLQTAEAVSAPAPASALAAVEMPPVQLAEAVPAPAPAVAEAPRPKPIPAVVKTPADAASVLSFAAAVASEPEAPAALPVFAPKKTVAKPAKVRRAAAPAPRPQFRGGNGSPVVQLGSYRSPQYVAAAWGTLTKRYPALRAYLPMRARFDSPKGTFWRLSIQGFANQREAIARCEALKNRGGSCFVRRFAGDTPVQYASR